MNPKKLIVSIVTSVVTFASLGALAVSAEDATKNPWYKTANVKTYFVRYSGEYALYYGRTDYTSVTALKGGYDDAYKYAQYIQYRNENGNYYRLVTKEMTGNTNTVMTNSAPVTGKVARRFHKARIHQTSESLSSVQETFTASITKW